MHGTVAGPGDALPVDLLLHGLDRGLHDRLEVELLLGELFLGQLGQEPADSGLQDRPVALDRVQRAAAGGHEEHGDALGSQPVHGRFGPVPGGIVRHQHGPSGILKEREQVNKIAARLTKAKGTTFWHRNHL